MSKHNTCVHDYSKLISLSVSVCVVWFGAYFARQSTIKANEQHSHGIVRELYSISESNDICLQMIIGNDGLVFDEYITHTTNVNILQQRHYENVE